MWVIQNTYDIYAKYDSQDYDDYKMLELDDVKTSVRIKNNNATLSNIVVNGYELNKEFNKDILSDAENKSNVVNDLNKKISILESSGKRNKANALRMAVGKISDPLVTSDLNKFTRDVAKQTSIVH